MCVRERTAAEREAADNCRVLFPLRKYQRQLQACDRDTVTVLPALYAPVFHTLALIWKTSRHYNTPARLTVIVTELSNNVVAAIIRFLDAGSLFKIDSLDALKKLKDAAQLCDQFFGTFEVWYTGYCCLLLDAVVAVVVEVLLCATLHTHD